MKRVVLPWIKQVCKDNPGTFPRGMQDAIIMMDRAPWHKKAIKDGLITQHMKLPASALVDHPPNSPDMQAPIEWSHAQLTKKVQARLALDPSITTAEQLQALVKETWDGVAATTTTAAVPALLTPDDVSAQFRKLAHTYKQVVEANGGWGKKGN